MKNSELIPFLKELWQEVQDDNLFNGAASLAFFLLLSIFPAAIFLLSLIPCLHIPHLTQAIMDLLHQVLPEQSANLFEGTVKQIVAQKQGGVLTFGFLFMVWSASTGIHALIEQVNIAYDVKDARPYWKVRGIAILLTFVFPFLMIIALSLAILGGVIQGWLATLVGWSSPLLLFFAALRWIIIAAFLLLGFALTYYFGPYVKRKFQFFSTGSLVGAGLVALSSMGLQLYISNFGNYNATYGSLGALIILMLWLYLAGIALLVGCEINALLEQRPKVQHVIRIAPS
jgi:membrane protein